MPFVKEDLTGNHYTWTNGFSFTGSPSRRLFDKTNGNQVLFIINFLASLSGRVSIREGREIEEMIHNHLPSDVRSEMSVFNWLRGLR